MRVNLKDGFEVKIADKHLNDWKLLKMLRTIDKGEGALVVDVMEILLGGEENLEALEKHLEKDGITTVDDMMQALREIIDATNELKNS